MDLMEIDAEINDIYQRNNYILKIIDHFSKFTGCYLLENKAAKEVLYTINEFLIRLVTQKYSKLITDVNFLTIY